MRNADSRLESPDEDIRLSILSDQSIDRDIKINIISGLTVYGISSQVFINFLTANPDYCGAISEGVIESPRCPDIVKVLCIHSCRSEAFLAKLLSSDSTSDNVYSEFNPEVQEAVREKIIRSLEKKVKVNSEAIRKALDRYIKKRAPFYLPVFTKQNPSSLSNRISSLIGGVPFTSETFEWPKCPAGKLLQPIVQINLQEAGVHLKRNFERGLLQVWARQLSGRWPWNTACPWKEGRNNFEIRFIPESALKVATEAPSHEDMPWMVSIEEFNEFEGPDINRHPCLMVHSRARLQKPRIQSWRCFGSMFPHIHDYSASRLSDYAFFDSTCIERVPNPDSLSIPNSCYLGGFGGGNSSPGSDPPYPLTMSDGRRARLLFNYQSAGDSYTAVNFSLFFAATKQGFEYDFHHYWSY